MRIATTLMLGAAALVLAAAPMNAQPAVAPQQPGSDGRACSAPTGARPATPRTTNSPPEGPAGAAGDAPPPARPGDFPPCRDTAALHPPGAPAPPGPATQGAPFTPAPAATRSATPPAVATASSPDAATATKPEAETEQAEAEPVGNPDDFNAVAATVNDESISDFEVRQRMALYLATSGMTNLTAAQRKRIRTQILEQLETEKVQLQEAVKKKITVSPVEVDRRINAMMAENRFTIQQLR